MAHSNKVRINSFTWSALYGQNLTLKVLGKEFEDDSPWDGEMSEGQRGQVPVRETLFQKGSSSI